MKILKAFPLALFVLAVAQPAASQYSGFTIPFGFPNNNAEETLKQTEERIKDIQSQSIPKNDLALTRELDSIDQEITSTKFNTQQGEMASNARKKFENISGQAGVLRVKLLETDCVTDSSGFLRNLRSFNGSLVQLGEFRQYFPDDMSNLQISFSGNSQVDSCENAKLEMKNHDYEKTYTSFMTQAAAALNKNAENAKKISDASETLLEELGKFRTKLRDALNNSSPQQKITADLPLILGILGGACVLAIVGVKLFDDDIQMEWVASGQVIQFVTVMVLLSVIAALGLSDILKENTLGTLLGGIAGYVLAQGVGRAAARDVARNIGPAPPARPRADPAVATPAQARQPAAAAVPEAEPAQQSPAAAGLQQPAP